MIDKLSFAEITTLFNDEDKAREKLEQIRWGDSPVCPHCDAERVYKITAKGGSKTRKGLWKCGRNECRKQFTVTVGTIFEGSRIPLGKWLMAIHLLCASKKGMSALQLMRQLWPDDGFVGDDGKYVKRHYKTAWFMCHRIRHAMSQEPLRTKLKGTIEADEVYMGGSITNMHYADKVRRGLEGKRGLSKDKAPVVTLVERGGRVKTHHMEHVTSANIKRVLRDCVAPDNAFLMTDEAMPYRGSKHMFLGHETVNHSEKEYVRGSGAGAVHCNTAESVHALLKRGVMGTYHHWSKKHLHFYLSEFDFRWNFRKVTDAERTVEAIRMVGGKRLSYKDPIKKH